MYVQCDACIASVLKGSDFCSASLHYIIHIPWPLISNTYLLDTPHYLPIFMLSHAVASPPLSFTVGSDGRMARVAVRGKPSEGRPHCTALGKQGVAFYRCYDDHTSSSLRY